MAAKQHKIIIMWHKVGRAANKNGISGFMWLLFP